MIREGGRLLAAAAQGWWDDRAMSMGAAVAFYTLFSLSPVLLVIIAVAGLIFGRDAAQGAIVAEIGGLVGAQAAESIENLIASASDVDSGLIGAAVGAVTFLVFATGAFVELQDDLNIIWRAKPPQGLGILNFVRTRLLSLALIVAIGFLLLVSLVVDAGLSALSSRFAGAEATYGILLTGLNLLISLVVSTVLFALMFKILPDAEIAWRDVAVGALLTAVLFSVGKWLIGLYLGQSNITSGFGGAASLITLLLWIYYTSQILLFGAEFTRAFAERYGSRAGREHAGATGRGSR